MSEERLPEMTVSLRRGRNKVAKVEVFRKSQWTGEPMDELRYRLRIDGMWYGGTHKEKTYLAREGLLEQIELLLAERGGVL